MNIIRMKDLLHDFKIEGICKDCTKKKPFEKMLEWQDLIGRSTVREIVDFWQSLSRRADDGVDQDTFLWANQTCLAPDMVNSLYRDTIGSKIKQQIADEMDKEYQSRLKDVDEKMREIMQGISTMNAEKQAWSDEKKRLELELRLARLEIERYEKRLKEHNVQIDALEHNLHISDEQAGKWQRLMALTKELIQQ